MTAGENAFQFNEKMSLSPLEALARFDNIGTTELGVEMPTHQGDSNG